MNMKKILYLLIALVTFTACEDWLDVAPNTDVPAKELFTTENGFISALAGINIVIYANHLLRAAYPAMKKCAGSFRFSAAAPRTTRC